MSERQGRIVESLQRERAEADENNESFSEVVEMTSKLMQRIDAREKSGDAGSVAVGG